MIFTPRSNARWYGFGAREGRQERVVDVDDRHAEPRRGTRRRGSACSGRARRGRTAAQQLEQLRLVRVRHVVVGDAEALDVGRVVRVVGGHERDRRRRARRAGGATAGRPGSGPPRETRIAIRFGRAGVGRARQLHVEPLGDLLLERAPERAEVALLEGELHPHEELAALGVGRVLVGADDVRAGAGEEARRPRRRCRAGRGR